jgi:hypothetical protein
MTDSLRLLPRPDVRRLALACATVAAVATLTACSGGDGPRTPSADTGARVPAAPDAPAPAQVPTVQQLVDSSLRAFRRGLTEVQAMEGGERSRDALVRRFVAAATARDTTALRRMLITRAEYAWLYFPDARLARPPYGIDPAFLWMQVGSNTERDLPKAFEAVGPDAAYAGVSCPDSTLREGPNRLHERCLAVVARGARRDTLSLFGTIVERDGQFKFLSYANRL